MGRKNRGTIYPRNGSWRIAYIVDGERHFETFETQEDAERELACRIADRARGVPVSSKPNSVLFGELAKDVLDEYKVNERETLEDIRTRFRIHINPVFALCKAASITTSQLNGYILQRRLQKYRGKFPSNGTINRELEAIRHVFRKAMKDGKLMHMPHVPHLEENNVREGFFTRQETESVCSHLPAHVTLFVKFGFLTGWRRGEISQLKWSNVDLECGEVRLYPAETKARRGRVFPITKELRSLLELAKQLPMERTKEESKTKSKPAPARSAAILKMTPYVFHAYGQPILEFRKSWATACQRAGLPVTIETELVTIKRGKDKGKEKLRVKRILALRIFHDMRRSAAKSLIAQGIPERVVMEMCGWKTRSVFDRYSVVGKSDIDAAREKMNSGSADHRFVEPVRAAAATGVISVFPDGGTQSAPE